MSNLMLVVPGMTHDLGGGFIIRRLLPYRKKKMVGPFVFFDHMGPVDFVPNAHSDIRPHPHIGLSTMTYLYEGRIVHRDHLGNVQEILPGEVNWMTAGRGIVHSERAHPQDYGKKIRMQGLQFWVALPREKEDEEPSFAHYTKKQIPVHQGQGFSARVVNGKQFGLESPVKVSSPTLFIDILASKGAEIEINPKEKSFEIAFYLVKGSLRYSDQMISQGEIVFVSEAGLLTLTAVDDVHFIVIGGEPLDSPRYSYWNFVSSSTEKLRSAKKAWKNQEFPLIPGDDQERIPLGE